ncbi:MAG: class I SAM-dependent methyltransferase [Planctomycetota bacterium]
MNNLSVDRSKNCCVCGAHVELFGRATVLVKYDVAYFRCRQCDFVQTEQPYWLNEAYASPISSIDLGLLDRNYRLAEITTRLTNRVFTTGEPCVDYGGGYGVFVRLMRNRGIPFYHRDPMAKNLFAAGFEARDDQTFALATAMEVFEHMVFPNEDLKVLDQLSPHWLVTTELVPESTPALSDWWYYMPEIGQHISFYSRKSLQVLGARYKRRVITCGKGLHLFTKSNVSQKYIQWILRNRTSRWLDRCYKQRSLLKADYDQCLVALRTVQRDAA